MHHLRPRRWGRMSPSMRSDVSTSVSSTSSSRGRSTRATASRSGIWKRVGYKWEKKRHSGRSTPQPQSTQRQNSNSAARNQTSQQETPPLQSINVPDITSCQRLDYRAHVGNETRNIEFKAGGGNYMQNIFCQHVSTYGCAFLNSGGGSLVVGVDNDGVVRGLHFSYEEEDRARLLVDGIVKFFHPPLLPHNYSLQFLPVVKSGVEEHGVKVLCLTFKAPPAFSEPTLYQTEHKTVYMRRDGSIEGPLSNSTILEWARQSWSGKVEHLQQCLDRSTRDVGFLQGEVHRLNQFISPVYDIIASLHEQQRTTPPRSSSSSQSSAASPLRPPVGSPYVRPAYNSTSPDLAPESPPPPEHRQM